MDLDKSWYSNNKKSRFSNLAPKNYRNEPPTFQASYSDLGKKSITNETSQRESFEKIDFAKNLFSFDGKNPYGFSPEVIVEK